jgi:ATP-dependent phosphofructokinase / diphosphate-dependent phosphofructokinase
MPKRIVILTGGGDVPGLNAVIKQVTYRGLGMDFEVLGLRRGWEGLTHLNLDDPDSKARYVLPLNQLNTRTIDRSGGTFLHSSRTNPAKMKAVPPHLEGQTFPSREVTKDGKTSTIFDVTSSVLKNLEKLGADTVVAIGGDDTLSYARRLHDEGVKVIAIPKTMDNDVQHTEYCIGFSTAITRAESAIQRQRTTVGSHERIGIFRIFGRDAGYTALYTAYVTNIRCLIPEYKPDLDSVIKVLVDDKRANPSNYSLVILSEGAEWQGYQVKHYGEADAYGHQKKAKGKPTPTATRKRPTSATTSPPRSRPARKKRPSSATSPTTSAPVTPTSPTSSLPAPSATWPWTPSPPDRAA